MSLYVSDVLGLFAGNKAAAQNLYESFRISEFSEIDERSKIINIKRYHIRRELFDDNKKHPSRTD